jgi:hypothetical protein
MQDDLKAVFAELSALRAPRTRWDAAATPGWAWPLWRRRPLEPGDEQSATYVAILADSGHAPDAASAIGCSRARPGRPSAGSSVHPVLPSNVGLS